MIHEHEWQIVRKPMHFGPEIWRVCKGCGESHPLEAVDKLFTGAMNAAGHATILADEGGVVAYDPRTKLVLTRGGAVFSLEYLAIENRETTPAAKIETELRRFPHRPIGEEGDVRMRAEEMASKLESMSALSRAATLTSGQLDEIAETMRRLGRAVSGNPDAGPSRPWTSDDALTLILEEIRHSPDPMTAAGQWITKFTNGVTDITRNLDERQ